MARNSNIITHIMQDPNSKYHLSIGLAVSLVTGIFAVMHDIEILPFISALIVGILIEVYQRVKLNGTNTTRESIFDAITTSIPGAIISIALFIIRFSL